MEPEKQQALPWEDYEDHQEKEVALLGRQSRRPENKPTAPAAAVVSGEADAGNDIVEEENKDSGTAAAAAVGSQKNSVYFDFNQGNESADGVSGMKYYTGLKSSVLETNSKDEKVHMEKLANKFEIQTILSTEINDHQLSEISRNLEHLDSKTEIDEDFDQESTDIIDVEGVLKKQNTHDLYCPNCNSCITRRVILRRRKPKIPKIRHKPKPDHKLETYSAADDTVNQGNDDTLNNVGSNDGLAPAAADQNHDTLPYIFRCLSCFTLFIPTGNGQVQYKPPSCTSWILAIFGSYKRKPDTDPDAGNREPEPSETDGINQHTPSYNMPPQADPSETKNDPETSSSSSLTEEESIPISGVGENPENDVVVLIGTQPDEVEPPPRAPSVDVSVQIHVDESRGPEANEAYEWDILKSIVYGGLGESITSLGVVTSAAAAGATTLNIFAMGLANLIGGLFVVAHNLRELKNEAAGESSTGMDNQEDRYKKVLGRRENFWVHATLVIFAFLIFGMMPPVIYGFSFRGSDDRDMKIAAVAVSSLACIMLLAIGKAHTENPPRSYMRTVFYYVSIGFMTSGLSYVAGDLIKKLVEQLHLFDSNLEPNLMMPEWASF